MRFFISIDDQCPLYLLLQDEKLKEKETEKEIVLMDEISVGSKNYIINKDEVIEITQHQHNHIIENELHSGMYNFINKEELLAFLAKI